MARRARIEYSGAVCGDARGDVYQDRMVGSLRFKDGSSDRTTGSAVRGSRFVYGVESESGVQRFYTKNIMLDASGNDTSEWTKSYQDMLGREYKTILSDANGSFSQHSFNTKGQLTKATSGRRTARPIQIWFLSPSRAPMVCGLGRPVSD